MKSVKKIIRVVLYIRVSTEEQVRHGYSIESQLKRLKEYCKLHGYKIVAIYIDAGKSARTKLSQRKELLRLLNDAQEGKFDRVVFWKLDRWFRNVSDYYAINSILEKCNVDWECSDEKFNTTTSNGRLYLNIKLSIGQNESDVDSDRIKFIFSQMIKDKKAIWGTNNCPLGYKVVGSKKNKRVIKDKRTSDIVEFIFKTYVINNSYRKTAFLVQNKFDYIITSDTIKKMLKNTLYYGVYRGVEGYCEPYITKEKFDYIQNLLPKNNKQNKNRDYIFSGLIVCKHCGCKMSGTFTKNKKCYRCGKYKNYRTCTNSKIIPESRLEEYLLTEFPHLKRVSMQESEIEEGIDFDKKLKQLNVKLDRLNEMYLNDRINRESYYKKYDETKVQINDLEKQKKKSKKPKEIIKLNVNFYKLY